ncbi:hypothetical protein TrVFT333_003226 [Trichoderma virens FT-333]|nr:hypothetical protein TrVFT333_003226 [Trichoderma virens FT-333]
MQAKQSTKVFVVPQTQQPGTHPSTGWALEVPARGRAAHKYKSKPQIQAANKFNNGSALGTLATRMKWNSGAFKYRQLSHWLSRPDKITQVPSGNQASELLCALLPKPAKGACATIILAPGRGSIDLLL